MKKFLMSAMALGLLVLSCGEKKDSSDTADKKIKIGVTIYKYDDNFMASFRDDLKADAEKLPNVELILNDSQNQQGIQNDQVDAMLSKGVDVLAINLVDPSAGQTIVDKAKEFNVPIVLFNKDPGVAVLNSYDKAYYVGNNPEESGVIQGESVVKYWLADPSLDKNKDGKLQYAMLKGEPGHPDAEARTKFSIDTINAKGIVTEKVFEDTGMWDASMAKDKVDAWLSSPNGKLVEVIIANNDGMALGSIEALKAHNVKLPVFGVDAIQEALELIEKGELTATVLNDGANQAQAVLDLSVNLAEGKDPLEGTNWKLTDKAVRVPYVGVELENLSQYKK